MRPSRWNLIRVAVLFAGLSPVAVAAGQADDQFQVAAAHYAAGRWELAHEEFAAFLREFPVDARRSQAEFFAGEALLQLDRPAEARPRFEAFLALSDEPALRPVARFRLAESRYLAGDLAAAEAELTRFLAEHGDHHLSGYARLYLADVALRTGRAPEARTRFEAVRRAHPDLITADAELGSARAAELAGDPATARRAYRNLADTAESRVADTALFRLAENLLVEGEAALAEAAFHEHTTKYLTSPWRTRARFGMARAALSVRHYDRARAELESLAADERLALETGYWLSEVDRAEGRWADAAGRLEALLPRGDDAPLGPWIAWALGDSWAHLGRDAEAQDLLERVSLHWPTSEPADDALLAALELAARRGAFHDLERIGQRFATEHSRSPWMGAAWRIVGMARAARRDWAPAAAALERAAALGESSRDLTLWRAVCHAEQGNLLVAREVYESASLADAAWTIELVPAVEALASSAEHVGSGAAWAESLWQSLAATDSSPAIAARGLRGLARLALARDDFATAEGLFLAAAEHTDAPALRAESLLTAARLAVKHHAPDRAAEAYARLLAEPGLPIAVDQVLCEQAWNQLARGDARGAEANWRRIHEEFPDSPRWSDATFRLAEARYTAPDHAAAESLVRALLARDDLGPIRPYALYLRAQLAIAGRRWDEAIEPLDAILAAASTPELASLAEYWRAEAAYRLDDFHDAVARLARIEATWGDEPAAWLAAVPLRRAQALAALGQWTEARAAAEEVLARWPASPQAAEADYVIGRAHAQQARFDEARQAFRRAAAAPALARTETAAMAQWMIGETYFHQQQFAAALREFYRVEALYAFPEWQAAGLIEAGKCHEELGDWAEAEQAYRRIVTRYPDTTHMAEAQERLGRLRDRAARPPRRPRG